LEDWLQAGLPMESLTETLQKNYFQKAMGCTTGGINTLKDLIPLSLTRQREHLKGELAGKKIVAVFDGTTRVGETLAVVLGFVSGHKLHLRSIVHPYIDTFVNCN
jgi:hypothetical protein